MKTFFRCLAFAVTATAFAAPAAAQTNPQLEIKIANGRATVIAKDVPLRQVLAEWARVGNTRMVNAEKMTGGNVSLELIDMAEKDALDILLRSAAGYMTGPRNDPSTGASLYDRVMILATSRPPANTGANQASFPNNRAVLNQIPQAPPDDDDGEPSDQGPVPPPGMYPGGGPPQGPPQGMPYPGGPQNAPPGAQMPPGAQQPPGAQPQTPFTAPRPGMIQPQPNSSNPYSPLNRPPGAPPPPQGGPPGSRPGGEGN